MNIITGTEAELKDMLSGAYQRRKKCKNIYDEYVLTDYISQLRKTLNFMTDAKSDVNQYSRISQKDKNYYNYVAFLLEQMDNNFIKYKEFHKKTTTDLLNIVDDELVDLVDNEFCSEYESMTKHEFYQYFYEFLKKYGFEGRFDRLISGGKIFNRLLDDKEPYFASVLYDPTKNRSSIELCEFESTIPYLVSLGHEFGHVYDLESLSKNSSKNYLDYMYLSVYGEVISTTFEKLFFDFLFEKQYRLDEVKNFNSEFLFSNEHNLLDVYMMSLLNDNTIKKGIKNLNNDEVIQQICPWFEREDEIKSFIEERNLSLRKGLLYSYGDFISSILKEDIKNEGFDSDLMRCFMTERTEMFNPEF